MTKRDNTIVTFSLATLLTASTFTTPANLHAATPLSPDEQQAISTHVYELGGIEYCGMDMPDRCKAQFDKLAIKAGGLSGDFICYSGTKAIVMSCTPALTCRYNPEQTSNLTARIKNVFLKFFSPSTSP